MASEKLRVGVLGATGSVGQRFVELLQDHPWFELTTLGASSRSSGKLYRDAVNWKLSFALPTAVGNMTVVDCTPENFSFCDFVFSGLDSSVAGGVEEEFAKAGFGVFSNASNHRMDSDVPLVIGTVNEDHMQLINSQREGRGWSGFIACNTNCSTTGLATALKPLFDNYGVEKVMCVTMQAVSGAGYPGLSCMDIHDNVVPYIKNEEEKMEEEPAKVLGTLGETSIADAAMVVSCSCNRVCVLDGHSMSVSVKLRREASVEDVKKAFREYRCAAQELKLPSAPTPPIVLREENDRPQPRLDRDAGRGFAVSVGRVRKCPILDVKFSVLVHNTVIGAAGGAMLNAEVAKARGLLLRRSTADA